MVGYELLYSKGSVRIYRYTVENHDDDYGIILFDLEKESYTPIKKAPSDDVGCYGRQLISAVLGYCDWPLQEKGTIVWY